MKPIESFAYILKFMVSVLLLVSTIICCCGVIVGLILTGLELMNIIDIGLFWSVFPIWCPGIIAFVLSAVCLFYMIFYNTEKERGINYGQRTNSLFNRKSN